MVSVDEVVGVPVVSADEVVGGSVNEVVGGSVDEVVGGSVNEVVGGSVVPIPPPEGDGMTEGSGESVPGGGEVMAATVGWVRVLGTGRTVEASSTRLLGGTAALSV